MNKILVIVFVSSAITMAFLRLILIYLIQRDPKFNESLRNINTFRFKDTLAIRLLERFDLFPARLRILAVIHFVAWAMAWILAFVLVVREIFLR